MRTQPTSRRAYRAVLFTALLFMPALMGAAQPLREETLLPDAMTVLENVRRAMPAQPIEIEAQLQSRNRKGEVEKTLNVQMTLHWGAEIPAAKYVLMDAFGSEIAEMDIRWPRPGQPDYRYETNGEQVEISDLAAPIEGLDFSWADLSLSYLWWEGGKTVGLEKKKGRQCYVLDLLAPEEASSLYSGVRLWVDSEVFMLLQADGYDAAEKRVRKLEVKSFKKIDEIWTIQNLDIQSYPSRHKTILRVRDMKVLTPET